MKKYDVVKLIELNDDLKKKHFLTMKSWVKI